MITDQEIDYMIQGNRYPGTLQGARNFARAVEEKTMATLQARIAELEAKLAHAAQAVRWAPSSAYWSDELRRIFGPEAREGIAVLEARLLEAQNKLAEKDALLRQALEDYANQYPHMQKGYMLDAAEAIRKHL